VIGAIFLCFLAALIFIGAAFPIRHRGIIEREAAAHGIDSRLVFSMIWTESKFDNMAVSNKGAMGLMQIMPTTGEWLAGKLGEEFYEARLFDAEFNIRLGVFYLRYLIDKFECEVRAIAAYNAGEGNVKKWEEGEIRFSETREYLRRVRWARKVYGVRLI